MIIPTSQAEQSRNIRWAFLHRACNLASMVSSVRAMSRILDPETEGDLHDDIERLKDRWTGEVMYAFSRGLLLEGSRLRRCRVE